uniref:p13 n=1 Tax=Ophiusa disjungens nucleopolyhedrovirus TaxID=521523 RepID=B6E2B6_9ABAC|nr:P13 [Ophiusa disjungens nucleopolyhedrovirus]
MFAYVTLVMLGDEYVRGAIALAKSLLCSGTPHDLVCMVTRDVSETAVGLLSEYYKVVVVDYLRYRCPPMLTKRQNQVYGPWIDCAFTKWQCLMLTHYTKIVYLDADHLVLKNIDHLFDLNAPAMCFADDNYGYYDRLCFGDRIEPATLASYMRLNKILCKGGTVLFKPDERLHFTIVSLLNDTNECLTKSYYHNGYDEQVLLQALIALNISVTQLSVLYAWNAGSYHCLRKNVEPLVINYYGDKKPWNARTAQYMDMYIWHYFNDTKFLSSSNVT